MLDAALNPSSVAVIGASDNPNKVGGRPLLYLSRFGFKGRIYPINPTRAEVQGLKSFPDLISLPEAPDLAVIATPGGSAMQAVHDCAARGVRAAIVMSSGFGETSDPQALADQSAMVRRARAAGMRLIGPNTQGLANFGTGTVASFSTMFLETPPQDGPIGIVSQSGMMSTVPYGLLRGMGLGVRHSHATGNEADVTLAEVAMAVLQDPDVRLLLLYIESIRDAATLAQAAALGRRRDVPIVAVKTGRTVRGAQAARSHTGALANDDRIVEAFFRRHGIWRVDDIHEQVSVAEMYLNGWRPVNRRLVVVSNSGASCVMAADSAKHLGLELATLSTGTVAALAGQLPSFATATNPIDITAALLTDSTLLGRMLSTLADGADADLHLVSVPVAGVGYDVPMFARDAAAFMATTGKALAVAAPQSTVAATFRAAGVPTFANQTEAIAALAQLAHHAALLRVPPPAAALPASLMLPDGDDRFLDEAGSLDWLKAHGLPTVPFRLCRSEAEAISALGQFGGKVAMKACASSVPHKAEHQLVMLGLATEPEVVAAYAALFARLRALGVEGVILVAPMTRGFEMMLGMKADPALGAVVLVGHGGTHVEVFSDTAVLMAPFSTDEARQAVLGLRIAPLFAGVRGAPPLDLEALCAAAVRLGEIAWAAGGAIGSIDLNPVMVGAAGEGVVIVDALIERRTD